jgi:phosphatidate cytidylyltransferase
MLSSITLGNPLLWPTIQVLTALFAVGGAGVVAVNVRDLRKLPRHVFTKRLFSWALIAPLFVTGAFVRPVGLVMMLVMVWQGTREYAHLAGLDRAYRNLAVACGVGTVLVVALWPDAFWVLPGAYLLAFTAVPLLTGRLDGAFEAASRGFLGTLYVAWTLAHMVLLVQTWGPGLQIALGLAIALSDVGAAVVGMLFGHRKLAPTISPNKTVAGVFGNVVGAALGLWLMRFALPADLSPAVVTALALVVGLACLWGDLIESFIKRASGVKDAGAWLPGFGGLLDRVDSAILAVPVAYYFLAFLC